MLSRLLSGFSLLQREGPQTTATVALRMVRDRIARRLGLYRGDSIMTDEWDLLIVLDACRVDAFSQVATEYSFIPNDFKSRYSVGSASDVWMKHTFTQAYSETIAETAYITANPNSKNSAPIEEFQLVEEVWRGEFDDKLGTIPPRAVTNQAIAAHREYSPSRMIVHYMQPHFPSIPEPLGFGIQKGAPNPNSHEWIWGDGLPDQYTKQDLWESYVENLRYVLDDVEVLVKNVNAEVTIITSDHGNAFGEWGLWGHPHQAHPVLRSVPWAETSANDVQTVDPDINSNSSHKYMPKEKLSALGYK